MRGSRPARRLGDDELDAVEDVAYSPDGSRLAAADAGGSVWVWEDASGEPTRLEGEASVQDIAFDGDGNTIAAGDSDGSIRLWDVASQEPERRAAHGPRRSRLERRPECGRRHPRLRRLGRRRCGSGTSTSARRSAGSRSRRAKSCSPSPSPRTASTLATGSVGGAVRLWDLPSRDSARRARRSPCAGQRRERRLRDGRLGPRVGRRRRSGPPLGRAGSPLPRATAPASRGRRLRGRVRARCGSRLRRRRRHRPPLGRDPVAGPRELESRGLQPRRRQPLPSRVEELAPGLPERTTCPT